MERSCSWRPIVALSYPTLLQLLSVPDLRAEPSDLRSWSKPRKSLPHPSLAAYSELYEFDGSLPSIQVDTGLSEHDSWTFLHASDLWNVSPLRIVRFPRSTSSWREIGHRVTPHSTQRTFIKAVSACAPTYIHRSGFQF